MISKEGEFMDRWKTLCLYLLAAASIFVATSCDTVEAGSNNTEGFEIGDTGPAGGLIFYIDVEDEHEWTYLEVAPASTEWELTEWGKAGLSIDSTSNAIGDGASNTALMITVMNSEIAQFETSAQRCGDLSYNGYDDWFLPSSEELGAIWDNLVDNGAGQNSGTGGFDEEIYWSSSQRNSDYAYGLRFDGSSLSYYSKSERVSVRAVRSF